VTALDDLDADRIRRRSLWLFAVVMIATVVVVAIGVHWINESASDLLQPIPLLRDL